MVCDKSPASASPEVLEEPIPPRGDSTPPRLVGAIGRSDADADADAGGGRDARGPPPARARGRRDDATRMTMWRAVSMSTLRRVVPSMTAVRERNHRVVVGVAARRAFERRGRTFATGGEGNNITSALMEQMREKIAEGLEAQSVDVNDLSGNGRHVSIKVVSQAFEGKSSVNRQRMVYKCIWMELQDQVHAVNEMVTMTPDEAAKM
jgi:stress-induced morphogen